MRFATPQAFYLLILYIPLIWVYIIRVRARKYSVPFSGINFFSESITTIKSATVHSVFIMELIALALLIVALARPQKGHSEEEITTRGVDIVLALDVSTSMKSLDFKPSNRLVVAKKTIKNFIAKRKHDRIGLVVFAGRSYTKCPLTLDYSVLDKFIDDIKFGQIEDGTAIGTALATAGNRLKDSKAKSKVIILATDGASNKGDITPEVAANAIAELGIKVYTIGIGKPGMVPYPMEYINNWTGEHFTKVTMVKSDLDEQALADIAKITGGKFFRATDAKKLDEVYSIIDKLEKSEIKTKTYTTYTDKFFPWLLSGIALLLFALLLKESFYRSIP